MSKEEGQENIHFRPERLMLRGKNNEILGLARLQFFTVPRNFCNVDAVYVPPAFQNQKHGRLITESFTDYIASKKIIGILYNAIEQNHPSRNMYEKGGWTPVLGWPGWMTYNFPKEENPELIAKMIQAIRVAHGHQNDLSQS